MSPAATPATTPEVEPGPSTIGVVGAGAMGQGIAQVALAAGFAVVLRDADEGAAARGADAVFQRLDRLAEKGQLDAAAARAARGRLTLAADAGAFAPCEVVVEAVVEDLEVKRAVFHELETAVRPEALLASNTSSLSVAAIARACARRGRVAGLHFFNPVPLMRLVEIVAAPDTAPATVAALSDLARRLGRTPVVVRDSPGFLVNFGGRAFGTEALAILHERVAAPADVDAVMRDCWGFRMGPFELMDLVGLDVNVAVTRIVHAGFFGDPRLRTTPGHVGLLESGRLGRKSGAGFYTYDSAGGRVGAEPEAEPAGEPPAKAVLLEPSPLLSALCAEAGVMPDVDDGTCPLLCAPWGEDCTAVAAARGADPRRLVAVDPAGDTSARVTLMTAPGADPSIRTAVAALAWRAGRRATVIEDSPGFIGQRIAAMVVNLGCEMAQMGLALPDDIDTAMRLGLNYPDGPLALGDRIGPATVLRILTALQSITGDDRYRPSQWLRRRALLGLSLLAPA